METLATRLQELEQEAPVVEQREQVRVQLDIARDAWETFREAYQQLGRALGHSGDSALSFETTRIDAYQPGFDPGYDWGMGMSADEWLGEIEHAINGTVDGEED